MSNKNSKDDANKGIASKHKKWEDESAKIRKVQISLDFPDAADILLRTLAAREHKAPSSMIREILGMPSSPPKRARIGVSFNDDELNELGQRYDIDPGDRAEIRRRMTEEVTQVLSNAEELIPSSEPDTSKQAPIAAMKELQSVSDSIHDRFKQALDARNKKNK